MTAIIIAGDLPYSRDWAIEHNLDPRLCAPADQLAHRLIGTRGALVIWTGYRDGIESVAANELIIRQANLIFADDVAGQ